MLFSLIAVYFENSMKHINTPCGQNVIFLMSTCVLPILLNDLRRFSAFAPIALFRLRSSV
jgi:hypothetical protein